MTYGLFVWHHFPPLHFSCTKYHQSSTLIHNTAEPRMACFNLVSGWRRLHYCNELQYGHPKYRQWTTNDLHAVRWHIAHPPMSPTCCRHRPKTTIYHHPFTDFLHDFFIFPYLFYYKPCFSVFKMNWCLCTLWNFFHLIILSC